MMDAGTDSNNLYRKKCQYLMVQKIEDEEQWISGEELRTDGSSDEEHYSKSQRKLRKMRRSIDNEVDKTIEVPSIVPLRSSILTKADNHHHHHKETFSNKPPKATSSTAAAATATTTITTRTTRTTTTTTTKGAESLTLSSSKESSLDLSEVVDLENQWRPKRGSIKLPTTSCDAAVVKKKIHEKVHELDVELKEVFQQLENEKAERLKCQAEILENDKSFDENATAFLDNCQFQFEAQSCGGTKERTPKRMDLRKKYIQRNIQLAKNASMANLYLTDEEKEKLNKMLVDLETTETPTKTNEVKTQGCVELEFDNDEDTLLENAYELSGKSKQRLNEIDAELKNYEEDEGKRKSAFANCTLEDIEMKLKELKNIDCLEDNNNNIEYDENEEERNEKDCTI